VVTRRASKQAYDVRHLCGHTATYRLGGSFESRERRQFDLANQVCSICAREQATNAIDLIATMDDQKYGMLLGTAQQVPWARRVRAKALRVLEKVEMEQQIPDNDTSMVQSVVAGIVGNLDANFWLDHRQIFEQAMETKRFILNRVIDRMKGKQ
jgi:hypothetical protein